ncbi:alpha-L-arabinofuranosidase 1-like isoform X1 [Prunus avium]|uniref:non-reducing end alpha-L-arabinofuranosidase n=1 Tax=Prunus avium TaxID=42229 RepID=A0A6P5TW08_PRUAV|nr:alpha-L-arabinofuranosidase 1-like isoform X1 [Prunus avium]
MGSCKSPHVVLLLYVLVCFVYQSFAFGVDTNQTAKLLVDASEASGRPLSETLFGIFFEEINHAGAGGLWAELVSNRGFEAGGPNVPSNIDPWSIIGNESSLIVSTDRSSCFDRNKVALRMEVLCDSQGANSCPDDGVGIYNPGFWGMNIEKGKTYSVVLYVRSSGSINVSVSLTGSDGLQKLAAANIIASGSEVTNWTKFEVMLEAQGTNPNSRLQLTTTRKGFIWFDQVSVMPLDTYKGHGFRKDLVQMLEDLKPQFMRFPGGCFVEGEWLRNAFRWKETIGPWEERPGHFADCWMYWTDDGLGYFEFLQVGIFFSSVIQECLEFPLKSCFCRYQFLKILFMQLAEDLGTLPIWVFNNGISHTDQVDTSSVLPFVQEALDGLEFARGNPNSTWGSLRAAMGHPEPFDLTYVGIGNEDCGRKNYLGNYLKFYSAIKRAYPDIKIISNCDGSSQKLDHPADLFDFHFYADDPKNMFSMAHHFDHTSRSGPKAFVSEYAVTTGSLLAALGEAGFLIGLEKNSDVVEMASYAPLFANDNGRNSKFSAIVFNSSHLYGTPSYWMQCLFKESSGATIFNATLQTNSSTNQVEQLLASAISWKNSENENSYLRIKIVNFGTDIVNLKIVVDGLEPNSINLSESTKTVLTSNNPMDENSLNEPKKVIPNRIPLEKAGEGGEDVEVAISPNSFTSIDFLIESS